ncbi:hypothetical protein QZH41_001747 [Actinostola sp. cb2023]|nr:hypothetical protein QZH41_001747 [Actinostola sp. cb2023]
MQDVLRTLKQEYPEIKKAHFRQDNAGCYHASTTILACSDIAQSTGVEIARLDFSDPQGGKGAADRLAATCKAHIRRFINEGNDVTTAKQLEAALLSHGSIEESHCKWLQSTFSPGGFKYFSTRLEKYDIPQHDRDCTETILEGDDSNQSHHGQAIYTCPQDGCVRIFQRLAALERHLASEKCTRTLEKHSLIDLAKLGYKRHLEEGVGVMPTLQACTSHGTEESTAPLIEGWALRTTKKAYRFSDKQKAYLGAKFQIGQSTGRKVDGDSVAREMRCAHGADVDILSPKK